MGMHNNSDRKLDLENICFSDLHWILKCNFCIGFGFLKNPFVSGKI